jgi:GTP-binding protein
VKVTAEFVTSAAGAGDFPRERLAEVAMVGRSNVGKSSVINALVRQPLARTSAAPGKTRLANFFRVQRGTSAAFFLVDLPGYGYARGGGPAAEEFRQLTEAYFARGIGGRTESEAGTPPPDDRDIRPAALVPIGVFLLVDSRHPGLESDLEAWEWLRAQPCQAGVIGTKADKLTRAERTRHARELESLFALPVPLVSAHTGEGLDELWTLIARIPKPTAA